MRTPNIYAQQNAALTAFPTFNGAVRAIAVAGPFIYVGGDFTQATNAPINGGNTLTRNRLAAIDANTGALLPWNPAVDNGGVYALAINGTDIYIGGTFTTVNGGTTRNRLCIFNTSSALNPWNPDMNVDVVALQWNGTRLIVGGFFTTANGGTARNRICSFAFPGGTLEAWDPNATPNPVLALAFNGLNVLAGGAFSNIGGAVRSGMADLDGVGVASPFVANMNNNVNSITVDGVNFYMGGDFTLAAGNALNRFCVASGGVVNAAWHPNINGTVFATAISGTTVYAGGAFTQVNGGPLRNGLAAFPTAPTAPTVNPFDPNITGGGVLALAVSGTTLYAAGAFTTVGGQPRQGFAAFSSAPAPTLGAAPASAYPMQVVTITGTNLNQPIGQVLFNGVPSPSIRFFGGNIEAVVPFGATTGPITVNTGPYSVNTGSNFTPNPIPQVATFVGRGTVAPPGNAAGQMVILNQPLGLGINATGDMFIAESVGQRIRRITPGGFATVVAGSGVSGFTNGLGTAAQFADPVAVAFDGANNLYVSDYFNNAIRRIDPSGNVTTLAAVTNPGGLVFDGTDLVVVSQTQHCVYKVTLGGAVTIFAGTAGMMGTTDAMGTAARFQTPMYIAKDASNNFYVTERLNNRIRKITPAGNVTTLAGSTPGFANGLGAVAQFNSPGGIDVDAGGVVYIGDGFDLASNFRVRMIQPNGVVTTLAGTGASGNTDGAYNAAQFPSNMAGVLVKGDTLFVSGRLNHDVRRIHLAKYQYVTGDAGMASSWRLLPGLVTPAPNFTGPGFQFILQSGTAIATTGFTLGANCVMTVRNGATLSLNSATTNSGAMIVENGGTLEVSNGVNLTNSGQLIIDNGATGGRLLLTGTGAIAGTTPVYGDAIVPNNATLEFGGAAAKTVFVSELPLPMPGRVIVSNTAGATVPAATTIGVTGTLTVNSGGRLIIPAGGNLQHNNATAMSFTVNNGGFLEIRDAGQISSAASPLNYVAGSTLEYTGTAPKATNNQEFPSPLLANLTINNTGNITLNAPKTLGASSIMTLTAGRVITFGFALTIGNTAAAAVVATAGYVDGILQRTLPMTSGVGTYHFPVGVGVTSYPFAVINPTTGITGPVLEVQAFTGNAMGTPTGTLSLLSTTEYWRMQQISGNYTSGIIFAQKAGLIAGQAIGTNGDPLVTTGAYNGTISTLGAGLTTTTPIAGVGHFLIGTGAATFVWNGATSDWQVATNWTPNRTTPAPTDVLQFNAGTWSPMNIPSQTIQQLIIGGNVTFAAGAVQTLSVGTGGVQIAPGQSLNLSDNVRLTQNGGGTIQVDGTLNTANSFVNGAGAFTLAAGGTLATTRNDGINGTMLAEGAVQNTGVITYNAGANYSFTSSSGGISTRMSAAGGKPAVTMPIGTLTVGGVNNITMSANITTQAATVINGPGVFLTGANTITQNAAATLNIASGAVLRVQNGGSVLNNNPSGTSFIVQSGGLLEIQGTGQVDNASASDVNYIAPNATLEYSGTAAKTATGREIANVQRLFVTNTMPVTLGANATVQQELNVADGSRLIIGSPTTLTLNGAINLNTTGLLASVSVSPGSLTLGGTNAVTVRFEGANNSLSNFTVNRTGSHIIMGDLNILGTLTLTNGILLPTTHILVANTAVGAITGGNFNSYVLGKLRRRFMNNIAVAGTSYAYPIGTGLGYRPATLVNTLTGAVSPNIEVENFDAGAMTFDATVSGLLSQRNWRVLTISGSFNGSAITLTDAGVSPASAVVRSTAQIGAYTNFGANNITTSVTSNAGAVPGFVNHYFAIATAQPVITTIFPTTVSPGDTVTINGSSLGGVSSVGFGGVPATSFQVISNTLIRAVVGLGAGGVVTLISPAGVANSMQTLVFFNAPVINSFSPSFGTTNSTMTIVGQRLSNPSNIAVGGVNALSIVSSDASAATVRIGNGASGVVTLQNAAGIATSASNFDFLRTPSIVNFFPKWAKANDTVNIFGGNFQRVSGVKFGNSTFKQQFTLVTNGQIRILMPPDATTGLIRMENPVGQDSLGIMTAVKQPTITSVQPLPLAAFGQTITITGTEFHPFPVVQIGSVTAATLEWTSLTEMRVTFAQATVGSLTVFASGGTVSQQSLLQIVAPPTVTSFSPASPLPGDLVTVTGASFIPNLLNVSVNGLQVQNLQRQSDNSLSFRMPNTTTGPIAISTLGGSTTATITFQPLTVTAAQPTSSLPGMDITLTGTRFVGITNVRFGGVTASQFTVLSPTQLSVRIPLNVTGGTTSIAVTGAAGTGVLNGFTVLIPAPVISSFSPFAAAPEQTVTISGLNFSGTTQVRFGGTPATQFMVVSGTQITATVPVGASSGSITVVNAAGMASRQGFTVLAAQPNPSAALSAFPTFNAAVRAVIVVGNTVYVGGDFSEARNSAANGGNTLQRRGLATIDATTGALLPWTLNLEGNSVYSLVQAGDRIFAGGDFTMVNDNGMVQTRNRILAFEVATGRLMSWNPNVGANNGIIRSLAMDGGVLHAVGDFTMVAGQSRVNACSFDGVGGTLLGNYAPNIGAPAFSVGISGAWAIIGGQFAQVNGNTTRANIVGVGKDNGIIAPWNPNIPTGTVNAVKVDGNTIYLGGGFPQVGGEPRNSLCAVDAESAEPLEWNPNLNGAPFAITVVGGVVYAGGGFTMVNGNVARNRLAAFPAPPMDATATVFNPNLDADVLGIASNGTRLFAVGAFTNVGRQPRQGFAAFSTTGASAVGGGGGMTMSSSANAPVINAISPETAAPMQAVTLTGANFTGITKVEFGEKEAWYKVVSPTQIRAVVPFGAGGANGGVVSVIVSNAVSAGSLEGFAIGATPLVSTLAGNGTGDLNDSAGQTATLNVPRFGTKIGNNLYFSTVHAIRKLNLLTGEVSTVAGSLTGGNADGTGAGAQFNFAFDVMPSNQTGGAGSSHLLVAEYASARLRLIDLASGSVSVFAGTGQRDYADGALDEASFLSPHGLARDGAGRIFVTDLEAHTVRFLQDGTVFTGAGNPDVAGSADGLRDVASFNGPAGIVFDNANNAYIADRGGNRIRKLSLEDETVTTLAGTGEAGSNDGVKGIGKFNSPIGLAINGSTLYVADAGNHRIRAVSTQTGEVVTVAGSTQGFADGTQQSAQFNAPNGIFWDNESNSLIVFDTDNNRIRRVVPGAITFAAATGGTVTMTTSTVTMTNATAQAVMRITDVNPKTTVEGSNITLTGVNISTNATVSIGSLPLQIIEQTTTAIVVKLPDTLVPPFVLSTNARIVVTSPTVQISVFPPVIVTARDVPFISIVFPSVATTRDVVSILGQHLAPLSEGLRGSVRSVSIGGLPVQAFSVISPTQIQVTVGSVRSGVVQVRTLSGQVLTSSIPFRLDSTRIQQPPTGSTTATMPPTVPMIPRVAPQDSIALNRLFAATQGMQWTTTNNWTNGAPVALRFGVRVRDERVVEIRLPSSGLRGAIPAEVLQALDKLEVLDLSRNQLSGIIPPMIANAQNLEVLNLQGNRFTGALPQGFCSMGRLRELNLAGNSLEDSIARLCCLTNAVSINLQGNRFVGTMPPCVQSLSRLSVLNLERNGVSGTIPDAIGQLRGLTALNLRGNRFTGAFPRALGQSFGLAASKRTAETQEALGLEVLDLGENNFTGEIPDEIGNFPNVRTILLDNNNFTGAIPKTVLSLNRLRTLDVRNNQLTSGPDLVVIPRLDSLLVQNNRFSVVSLERFFGVRVFRYLPQTFTQPLINARLEGVTTTNATTLTVTVNEPLTLSIPRTENFSRTEWRKNGVPIARQAIADTSRHAALTIPAFTLADTGVYDCIITNERLTDVVLTSASITVRGRLNVVAPSAVQLLEPGLGEEDVPVQPQFRWTSVVAAEAYRIELASANDTNFAQVLSSASISQSAQILAAGEVVANSGTVPPFFQQAFPLQNDRRYLWRVRAENSVGASAWAEGTFTTVPQGASLTIGTLDFGRVSRFDSVIGGVRIRNFGAGTLTIESIQADNRQFVVETVAPGTQLPQGQELRLNVFTRSEIVGNNVSAITVRFRTSAGGTIQTRTMQNRIFSRVQAIKLFSNRLDTVIVGRRIITSIQAQNMSDEAVTVRSVVLQNMVPDFVLRPVERDLELLPNQAATIVLAITAQQEGELPEEVLRMVTIRGNLSTATRDRFDTLDISSRLFARRARREDVFVRVGFKAVPDSIAPGGSVTLELSLTPLGTTTFEQVRNAGTPSFAATLRWNPNVMVLAQAERGVRPVRVDSSTRSRQTGSDLQQFAVPQTFWDGRTSLLLQFKGLSVAGNTDVTPLLVENFQWGASTVFVDDYVAGRFTAKACEAGGKRLVTTAQPSRIALVAPNPVKDEVRIAYTLREDGFAELALVDASGKVAKILVAEEQTAGDHEVRSSVSMLPSGTYTIRLQTSTGAVSTKVNVVR
jgi:sugar lactone lactonase YvrE